MKRLLEIAARKVELRGLLESDGQIELQKVEQELKVLETEETELRRRLEVAKGIEAGTADVRKVATITPEARAQVDLYDTVEYRKAFMSHVTTGADIEKRTTELGDIGAVIPTTIINKIVERMETVGRIWRRVSKSAVQGGVQIPVSTAKPTASWVAAGTMSAKQDKVVSGTITFSYHKLQCRVAVELVAGTVAMPAFEATVANNIAEAMVRALDHAIVRGTGTGQPLGIINQPGLPADRIADVTVANFNKYDVWMGLLGRVPAEYREGAVLLMNDADWHQYILGMVDTTGQPIARVTMGLNGGIVDRFLGHEVIVTEHLPSITPAGTTAGTTVAVLVRLEDYLVNSNKAITYRRYFDEDTDEWVSKATLIADGKLADINGVVLIRKA